MVVVVHFSLSDVDFCALDSRSLLPIALVTRFGLDVGDGLPPSKEACAVSAQGGAEEAAVDHEVRDDGF